MPHPVVKFQILSADPEGTTRFYTELFGWTVNADNPLGYREISTGSPPGIDGGIWPAPQQAQNLVQLFVYADDVKGVVDKAQGLGAKLVIPPTMLPQGEEMAVMVDPKGMTFAVWRSAQP